MAVCVVCRAALTAAGGPAVCSPCCGSESLLVTRGCFVVQALFAAVFALSVNLLQLVLFEILDVLSIRCAVLRLPPNLMHLGSLIVYSRCAAEIRGSMCAVCGPLAAPVAVQHPKIFMCPTVAGRGGWTGGRRSSACWCCCWWCCRTTTATACSPTPVSALLGLILKQLNRRWLSDRIPWL